MNIKTYGLICYAVGGIVVAAIEAMAFFYFPSIAPIVAGLAMSAGVALLLAGPLAKRIVREDGGDLEHAVQCMNRSCWRCASIMRNLGLEED